MKTTRIVIAAALLGAGPAAMAATAPPPATFVATAGASDMFEIESAKLMTSSTNPQIKSFAQKMITDHSKSTSEVKTAAKADGMKPKPPMLDAKQKSDLAALKAAKGKQRDDLYIQQQKPAHEQALMLMTDYSASGSAPHLKSTAGMVKPVVQSHIDMLNQMPAM